MSAIRITVLADDTAAALWQDFPTPAAPAAPAPSSNLNSNPTRRTP
jgi:hypothetical protein